MKRASDFPCFVYKKHQQVFNDDGTPALRPLAFFDIAKEMCWGKEDLDFSDSDIIKAYDVYMLNRWLSMVHAWCPYVLMMNHEVDPRIHYAFFKNLIPKGKYTVDYILKPKKEDNEVYNSIISSICKYFKCGRREAEDYKKRLSADDLLKINKKCGRSK